MGQRIAIFFLRVLGWKYYWSPAWVRRIAARFVGRLLRAFKIRRDVVRANLDRAYPGEEQAALRARIEKGSYEHVAQLGFEILMLFGPMHRFVRTQAELHGIEHWQKAQAAGHGVILLSSHVGNWEVMAATGAIHAGMDLLIVTKHLKPEWLHREIESGRRACGVAATYEPKTMRDVLSQLRKNATVGFVLDQYAGPPIGVRVPVFGFPVGTPSAVAALARRTGAPVLPVVNFRDSRGRFKVEIRPPLEWRTGDSASLELATNTAGYAEVLEEDVRAHPEQWLWIHRRFKGDLSPLRPGEWLEGRARR